MLIFDLDGTILDSNHVWNDVDKTFLARRGVAWSKYYYEHVAHTPLEECADFARDYLRLDMTSEEIIAEWMAIAGDEYRHVPLKPGALEYMRRMKAASERLALFTTAVPAHARTALEARGIADLFDHVLLTHELGVTKKSPHAYVRIANLMRVDPADCTMFDDSVACITAAKEAGMRTVGVFDKRDADDEDRLRAAADRYVRSFEELLD